MHEAVLWNGPVLELGRGAVDRLGPDILEVPPAIDEMVANLQRPGVQREIGDALVDQRLVAGIGNMWRAEALYLARVSPWAHVHELGEPTLRRILGVAATAMTAGRGERLVYRRARLPCRRCGVRIQARRQGEAARTAYWCPGCQAGSDPVSA